MTLADFLHTATRALKDAGIDSARLDVLILLEDTLQQDRASLLAHPEIEILPSTEIELNKKIAQRAIHTPLAYIRGRADFYGRTFTVTPAVLVPRPETEAMIELLIESVLPPAPYIIDVGTGSGCIGLTAALEMPTARVLLTDNDNSSLAIAEKNMQTLQVKNVELQQRDLLEDYSDACDVILANLPYVPDRYSINQAATHEPKGALFAGEDGLDLYRRFWNEIASLTHRPSIVLTESLLQQHSQLAALAELAGYTLADTRGLIQKFTV